MELFCLGFLIFDNRPVTGSHTDQFFLSEGRPHTMKYSCQASKEAERLHKIESVFTWRKVMVRESMESVRVLSVKVILTQNH